MPQNNQTLLEKTVADQWQTLPSGLTVLVRPMPGYSSTHVIYATKFGSIDRDFCLNGQTVHLPAGVAHFLEHKMFEDEDGDAFAKYAKTGANANAFTSFDRTCYLFTATQQLDESLDVLLGMVGHPYFTEQTIAKEQGIIGQEIKMYDDSPDWRLITGLFECLYHSHPIRSDIAGTVESIAQITPDVLERCHRTFYHPSNMVLCVEGCVEPRKIFQMAAALVPSAPPQTIHRDHGAPEAPESACQEVSLEMEVSAPSFLLGFKAEPGGSLRRKLAGELAAELLAGESSPLYARLYQQGLIDKSFGVEYDAGPEIAHFIFGGESPDPAGVSEAILSEGVRIAWNGLDEALFQRVRKALYGAKVRALNSFEHTCIQMARGHFEGCQYLDFSSAYEQITRQEVEELLRESITGVRSALSIVKPKGA